MCYFEGVFVWYIEIFPLEFTSVLKYRHFLPLTSPIG